MVSASAWRPLAGVEFSPIGAREDASACPPELPVASAIPRLKRRSDYLRIAKNGRTWAAPGLILQMRRRDLPERENASMPPVRFGITASRKVGNAVARNRVRRRLRSVAEQVLSRHAEQGCDYVVIGRAATLKRPFAALVDDLASALKRLKAFRDALDDRKGNGEQPMARR